MTDNEIIKALECCCGTAHDSCRDCPYSDIGCEDELEKDALDLINRQKAEIERLKNQDVRNKYPTCVSVVKGRIYTRTLEDYDELIGDISAEAVKEFAERLKEKSQDCGSISLGTHIYYAAGLHHIDNLVKEFTERSGNDGRG